ADQDIVSSNIGRIMAQAQCRQQDPRTVPGLSNGTDLSANVLVTRTCAMNGAGAQGTMLSAFARFRPWRSLASDPGSPSAKLGRHQNFLLGLPLPLMSVPFPGSRMALT